MRVTGADFWRLGLGELRVLYVVGEAVGVVVVLKVARQAESTYRRLKG